MTNIKKLRTAALYIVCAAACAIPVIAFINILVNP